MADRLCFGFVADPTVVEDVDVLARAAEEEAAEVVRAGQGAQARHS